MTPADDERAMLGYVLGTLPPAERDAMDAALAADPDFFDRLEAFEDDLILRWHRGQLDSATRAHFEHAYASAPRQQRVQAVLQLLGRLPTDQSGQASPVVRAWWLQTQTIPRWAIAASVLLVGGGLLGVLQTRADRIDGATAAVVLSAAGERGSDPARGFDYVRLLPGYVSIELHVLVPGMSDEPEIRVELVNNDDPAVAQAHLGGDLQRDGDWLVLKVPASAIRDGDYLLTVSAGSADQDGVVARRAFRVSRAGPR